LVSAALFAGCFLVGALGSFGLCGFGGVLSIRFSVSLNLASSSLGVSDMSKPKKGSLHVFGKASHNVSIYIAIGQLIVHWANNESLFMRILHSLMGGDDMKEATTIFHSHKNTMGRLDLIQALGNGKITDTGLKDELARLIRAFKGLSKLRNFLAHATYSYSNELAIKDAAGVIFDNQQGVFRMDVKSFDLATMNEIDNVCLNAVTLNRELWAFALELDQHLGRSAEMPRLAPPLLQDELAQMISRRSAQKTAQQQEEPPSEPQGE
jgi:hypothetical protein